MYSTNLVMATYMISLLHHSYCLMCLVSKILHYHITGGGVGYLILALTVHQPSLISRPSHLFNVEKVGGPGDEANINHRFILINDQSAPSCFPLGSSWPHTIKLYSLVHTQLCT